MVWQWYVQPPLSDTSQSGACLRSGHRVPSQGTTPDKVIGNGERSRVMLQYIQENGGGDLVKASAAGSTAVSRRQNG